MSSAPRFAPSNRNCTPATATLSEALAETVTRSTRDRHTVGRRVIDTVGTVVSLLTVTVTLLSRSPCSHGVARATAVSVWLPLVTVAEFQLIE